MVRVLIWEAYHPKNKNMLNMNKQVLTRITDKLLEGMELIDLYFIPGIKKVKIYIIAK